MKKYNLDLSEFKIEVGGEDQIYPLRENLSIWLRSVGIFHSGEDIAEAVSIAKQIRNCEDDLIILDEREANILKQGVNRLVELTADGKANLGGEVHEEAIVRVIKMKEVEK